MATKSRIINRNRVIKGATDDSYSVKASGVAAVTATEVRRTLTLAEMQSLGTTRIVLTDPPKAGGYLVLVSLRAVKAAGGYSSARPLEVLYGEDGPQAGRVTGSVLSDADERDEWGYPARPEGAEWPLTGAPLVASSDADYSGNGGAVELTVRYIEVTSG